MKYFVTIDKNGEELMDREEFDDYQEAMEACAKYYTPRANRSVLTFTTEAINGKFARSFAELNRPEHIGLENEISRKRHSMAVKLANAFEYSDSYFFLIESEVGINDAKQQQ